jgi:hypothetical protein
LQSKIETAPVVYRHGFLLTGMCLVVGLFCGCTPQAAKTYPAVIKLTYPDKKPVVGAQVVLRSDEAKVSARGIARTDGSCLLTTFKENDGAVAGHHKVLVAKPPLKGDPDKPYSGPLIADKYASFTSSGLEVTVTNDESKNVFNLTVTAQ